MTKKAKRKTRKKILINFILDETGSMLNIQDKTISGFNEYVASLCKKNEDDIRMTLTKFNSTKVDIAYANRPIKEVKKLSHATYRPDALTPLYDAIAKTIKRIEKDVTKRTNVLTVIMTDGYENDSREYKREDIFKMIKDKEQVGWSFVYLGANQDSWAAGQAMGLKKGNVADYNQRRTKRTFRVLAGATMGYAMSVSSGTSASTSSASINSFFSKKDKEELKKGGDQNVNAK
jgi:uncharacterized protein YegL